MKQPLIIFGVNASACCSSLLAGFAFSIQGCFQQMKVLFPHVGRRQCRWEADFESAKGSVEKSMQHPRASRCRDKHDPGDQCPQEQGELAGAASHPPLVWGLRGGVTS